MSLVVDTLRVVLFAFFILLFARVAVSFIIMLARNWRPRGMALVLVEGVLSTTDPPVRAVRKILPPIDLGGVRLDLSVLVLMLLATVLMSVLAAAPTGG